VGTGTPGRQGHQRSQPAALTRHRPVQEHHRAQPSQPPTSTAPPPRHSARRRGWGPPGPCGVPGYFGPLCPRCSAGRWHCPWRRCPMTAAETLPAAGTAGWAAMPIPVVCAHRCPHPGGPYRGRAHSGPGCTPAARRGGVAGGCPPPRPPAAAAAGPPRPWRRCPGPACSAHTSAGEGAGRGVSGGLASWLPRPSGETEAGSGGHAGTASQPHGGAGWGVRRPWHPQGKRQRCLRGSPAARRGVGRGRAGTEWGDRWRLLRPRAQRRQLAPLVPVPSPAQVPRAPGWAGGGWGRASGDGRTASLAGRLSEG